MIGKINAKNRFMKILFFSVVAIIVLTPLALLAQVPPIEWTRTFGTSTASPWYEHFACARQTEDGGYIVAGGIGTTNDQDAYLVKLNSSGYTIWEKTYDYAYAFDFAQWVEQTTDGGYIMVGGTWEAGVDYYVIRTSPSGDLIWEWHASFGGNQWEPAYCVQQTQDGGFIVVGDPTLVKINPTGDTIWTRDIAGHSIQGTSDLGYVIAGDSLIKTDFLGNTIWTKPYDCSCAQQLEDGGYIAVGTKDGDLWLIRTDSLGDSLWARTYGDTGDECGTSVEQTVDGGYIIVGETNSFGAGGFDVWVLRTDPYGDTLWTATYGGDLDDCGKTIQQTEDGGYIIGANTKSYGAGDWDMWIIKLASESLGNGCIAGVITEYENGPIEGAIVTVFSTGQADTTDTGGEYFIEDVFAGSYTITAGAFGYNDSTVTGIDVFANETTHVDFSLTHPEITVQPMSFDDTVALGTTLDDTLYITNNGNGPLDFRIAINENYRRTVKGIKDTSEKNLYIQHNKYLGKTIHLGTSLKGNTRTKGVPAFEINEVAPNIKPWGGNRYTGEILWWYDVGNPSGDYQCLGVEFDGSYYYITGGGSGDPNKIHFFDTVGNYITSIAQPTPPGWGWRDIAYDGACMYSSDNNNITQWFITGLPGNPQLYVIGTFPGPESPNRALAYDPSTDHFWVANYDSPIYEINRSGGIINTFSNSYDIYGLAWDDISPGGPWLWVYTQDLYFARQFDPQTGTYTGLVYEGYASGEAVAGGAAFALQDGKAVFIGLTQGSPDLIFGMEVSPSSPSWISAEPAIGTVLPGETFFIVIHLDASQATHSFYNADILIHNNSATPEISIPVTMYVPSVGGTLKGTVTDATKSPIAGALVTACNSKFYWDITDSSGRYEFYDIYPDTFDMEVTAFGYNEFDTTGVVLLPGDTTVVNISLTYPEIVVEPDNFYVTLLQDSTLDTLFYITNNGTGFLTFDIACVAGSLKAINPDIRLYQSKDMQSSLCESYNNWRPDSLSLLNGGQIIESYPSYGMPAGIEWDGTYFWQGNWDGYVVKLDSNFNYITQYQACGDLSMPPTGLTWHNGYLYQSCYTENNVYKIDVSSGYIPVDTIHVPGNGGLMGIEWIDNHLWVTDDDTELIYECDSLGNVINSWAAPDLVPYGISYNPYFDCIFLNGWSGGNIYTIDPHTGNCTFAFPTPGTGGAYSCAGSSFDNRYPTYLWITHQSDHMIYLVDTRSETWWITVDPIAGIVDPGETFEINVHFDAFIAQDTLYIGTIAIHNNSIDSLVNIPVSLRVTAVSIKESRSKIPRVFALTQNYPNPVFRNTVISYQLPKKSKVNLKVYNACGMLVKTLVNGTKEPGFYTIEWNPCDVRGRKLASGIYFYRFVSGNYKSTKKMVLIRER